MKRIEKRKKEINYLHIEQLHGVQSFVIFINCFVLLASVKLSNVIFSQAKWDNTVVIMR